jgi:multiple sugar transport system permease protein
MEEMLALRAHVLRFRDEEQAMIATNRSSLARSRRSSKIARRERNWGLIFLAPWIAGFLIFFFLPMLASLVFSFTNFNLVAPDSIEFVGLENWKRMIGDENVRQSLSVTLRFMLISVPITIALPLMFALMLNSKYLLGKRLFRTLFYMPFILPLVATTMIWQGTLNAQSGWLNRFLGLFGVEAINWLNTPKLVVPTLTMIGLWGIGNTMLIFLTSLQGVPTELYEAAKVDGAGPLHSFINITLPMISPVIFYNLVLGIIAGFQELLRPLILFGDTNGAGPDNAALFYMVNLYREAFVYYQMGYASALAWAMFIIALVVTIALFRSSRHWVYYAGGEA